MDEYIMLTDGRQKPIYRYLSYSRPSEIPRSKAIAIVHPSLWDDPFENCLVGGKFRTGNATTGLALRHTRLGSCWTRKSVPGAMWRIYSTDKTAVCIKSIPELVGDALLVLAIVMLLFPTHAFFK
jgi:hypothetical protein